jgi:Tfp pilus assembly protein PilO
MKGLIDKIKSAVLEMRDDVLVIYSEKGIEPFKKPLLIAAPAILILYGAVYAPSADKYAEKKIEAEHLEAISVHYSEYNDMISRKSELRRRMPLAKDKGEWLSYILTSTSKAHGITFDSLMAQEQQKAGPLLLVSRGASVTSTYEQIGKWLAEVENSKIFLKITELQISRRSAAPGMVKVTIKLSTVFPDDSAQNGGGI